VGLYEEPEKPSNALDFLKQHLGAGGAESADVEALKLEVTELKQENERLLEENNELKQKVNEIFYNGTSFHSFYFGLQLAQYEPPAEEQAPEN
jgi:hypothetical protein